MCKKTALALGISVASWLGCAAQKSNIERESAAGQPHGVSPAPLEAAQPTPEDADSVRRFLCGRARGQLEQLESEMARVIRRLQVEGTDAQRTEWVEVLGDIEHDRQLLAEGLLEAERAPIEAWAEKHGILPSMIDVLSMVGAQAVTEIDRDLDSASAPTLESSDMPSGT